MVHRTILIQQTMKEFTNSNGRSAGNYTLTAEYLTLSQSVNVEVFPLWNCQEYQDDINS